MPTMFMLSTFPCLAMPMGQMPVLEVDGFRVHQSISMARYLAKRVGLAGANDWENLLIDTAVDTVNDFRLSEYTTFCGVYARPRQCARSIEIQLLGPLQWLQSS